MFHECRYQSVRERIDSETPSCLGTQKPRRCIADLKSCLPAPDLVKHVFLIGKEILMDVSKSSQPMCDLGVIFCHL